MSLLRALVRCVSGVKGSRQRAKSPPSESLGVRRMGVRRLLQRVVLEPGMVSKRSQENEAYGFIAPVGEPFLTPGSDHHSHSFSRFSELKTEDSRDLYVYWYPGCALRTIIGYRKVQTLPTSKIAIVSSKGALASQVTKLVKTNRPTVG